MSGPTGHGPGTRATDQWAVSARPSRERGSLRGHFGTAGRSGGNRCSRPATGAASRERSGTRAPRTASSREPPGRGASHRPIGRASVGRAGPHDFDQFRTFQRVDRDTLALGGVEDARRDFTVGVSRRDDVVVDAQLFAGLELAVAATVGLVVDDFDAVVGHVDEVHDPRDGHALAVDGQR